MEEIEALRAEIARKEEVIEKYRRGMVRREEMADMIERLIQDRDHWRSMAQKGSRSVARKLNEYRDRALRAETEANRLRHEVLKRPMPG